MNKQVFKSNIILQINISLYNKNQNCSKTINNYFKIKMSNYKMILKLIKFNNYNNSSKIQNNCKMIKILKMNHRLEPKAQTSG